MIPRIRFTEHAVERFNERVRPTLDRGAAFAEMRRVAALGSIQPTAPDWASGPSRDGTAGPQETLGWLVVGDVAFPLIAPDQPGWAYSAATCLTRGALGGELRREKNRRKSKRGMRKRAAKNSERRNSRAFVREPLAEDEA
jgi:hypothetical protein